MVEHWTSLSWPNCDGRDLIDGFLLELIRVTDSLSHDSPLEVDKILTTKGVGETQAVSNHKALTIELRIIYIMLNYVLDVGAP